MLSLKYIRENLELVKTKTTAQNTKIDFDEIINLDKSRRELIAKSDDLKSEKNSFSKKIGMMKKNGEDVSDVLKSMKNNSEEIKKLDDSLRLIDDKIENLLLYIPNTFHDSVPIGNNENDNVLVKEWGSPEEFNFTPKDHIELGENLGLFDFKRAKKCQDQDFLYILGLGQNLKEA